MADILRLWPEGLQAFLTPGTTSKKLAWVLGPPGMSRGWPSSEEASTAVASALVVGSDAFATTAPPAPSDASAEQAGLTREQLGQWSGALQLVRGAKASTAQAPPKPNHGWLHGALALLWMMQAKGNPVSLDLCEMPDKALNSDALAVLSRGVAPSLTALSLAQNNLSNMGGDYGGLRRFCAALRDGLLPQLCELNLAGCQLREESAALIEALRGLPLQTLNLSSAQQGNQLTKAARVALGELLRETRTLATLVMEYNELRGDSGIAFARARAPVLEMRFASRSR